METFNLKKTQEVALPPSHWSSLPADILIAIMGFVPPYDILTLRTVSKSTSQFTYERSVWIDSLRRACIQHDIYTPSFPLTEMSLDELEHAATACGRFSSRLRHNFFEDCTVWPHYVQYLEPAGHEFENLRLIPGGRFLLTSHKRTIQLWDLGNHLCSPKSLPITSLELAGVNTIESMRTRASSSNSDALVIVSAISSDCTFCVFVFNIFPPASTPEFKEIAPAFVLSIEEDEDTYILGATNRHVAVGTEYTIVLWDFIDNTWVNWQRDPTYLDDTFYLCNDDIVIMRADKAEIWIASMPPLHPRSMSATPPEIDSLKIIHEYPLYRFRKYGDSLRSCVGGVTLVFHGREHSTHRQPLHIDILSKDRDQALLTHFALVPVADSSGSQAESPTRCMLTGLGESSLRAAYSKSHSLHLEWTERGTVQSFVVEGNTLHVCLSDVDGKTSESLS
ncbi:hypothetical protein C8R47DRAFT_1001492, partial [Mycena vitilis]